MSTEGRSGWRVITMILSIWVARVPGQCLQPGLESGSWWLQASWLTTPPTPPPEMGLSLTQIADAGDSRPRAGLWWTGFLSWNRLLLTWTECFLCAMQCFKLFVRGRLISLITQVNVLIITIFLQMRQVQRGQVNTQGLMAAKCPSPDFRLSSWVQGMRAHLSPSASPRGPVNQDSWLLFVRDSYSLFFN